MATPVGGGEYVVVTREELKDAAPGKSELIEIQDFVDLDDIEPPNTFTRRITWRLKVRGPTVRTRCSFKQCAK